MTRLLRPLLLTAGLVLGLAHAALAAQPEKSAKSLEQVYEDIKGPWWAEDGRSPLAGFSLERSAKVAPAGAAPWLVRLDFRIGSPETYRGPAQKVEVEGDGLRVTLPPSRGQRLEVKSVRIRRDGDRLEVQVAGYSEVTYRLKRLPPRR